MTLYYLAHPNGQYSNAADYPQTPTTRSDGTWVAGNPPAEMTAFLPVPKKEAIQATIGTLSFEKLAPLMPVIAQGAPFMDAGRWDVVGALANQVVSSDPDVVAVIQDIQAIITAP